MARAKWTTNPREVVMTTDPVTGAFLLSAPLLDGGVKQFTLRLEVTADREVKLLVDAEPGAVLSGFQAWSDI